MCNIFGPAEYVAEHKTATLTLTETQLATIIWVSTFMLCPFCGADMGLWSTSEMAIHTIEHMELKSNV